MNEHYGDYHSIEQRIEYVIEAMQNTDRPKITTFAREFRIPYNRLWRRVQGQRSKSTRPSTNKLLNDVQEQAVKSYLVRCDKLGMPAIVPQLKGAIQHILDLDHPDGKAPPLGQHFIVRWLAVNSDCKRIKQKPKEINQVAANVGKCTMIISMSLRLWYGSMVLFKKMYIIWMRQASELALAVANGLLLWSLRSLNYHYQRQTVILSRQ